MDLLARQAFPLDFSWIYAETDAVYADLAYLADAGLIHFNETEVWRDPLAEIEVTLEEAPELTSDQRGLAADSIRMAATQAQNDPVAWRHRFRKN
jgi:hypothetical protein